MKVTLMKNELLLIILCLIKIQDNITTNSYWLLVLVDKKK